VRFYLLVGLVAAVVSFLGSLVMLWVGRKYKLHPAIRERDVHTVPTPRLGGIAMFVGVLGAMAFASQVDFFQLVFADPGPIWAIVGAAALIVLVGVADDFWDLDWMTKLAGQAIAAALLAWQGVQILSLPLGNSVVVGSSVVGLGLTVFLVVLVMNAINFIDGLDGLVAGVAIVANGVFFLYSYLLVVKTSPTDYFNLASLLAIITVGVCVGFLPLNWNPAKLFMGDAGALMVGMLMATSTIAVTGQVQPANLERTQLFAAYIPILLPFAILIVPLLDFSMAVLRRLRAGKSPFSADRKHLHHRLLDLGHSPLHAVLIFYGWTAVFSVSILLFFAVGDTWWPALFLIGGLLVCAAVTFAPIGRRRRHSAAERLLVPARTPAAPASPPAAPPTAPKAAVAPAAPHSSTPDVAGRPAATERTTE
jgi:UDP-GlcNAc:undecaprenyl-phosphate/decaprenyl-phosphate GlcNAc-1-phosphate transferase